MYKIDLCGAIQILIIIKKNKKSYTDSNRLIIHKIKNKKQKLCLGLNKTNYFFIFTFLNNK